MILRGRVDVTDNGGTTLATIKGQVSYRNVTLDQSGGGYQIEQQLTALTEPYDWQMGTHKLRYRDTLYPITGVLWRQRNGRDHHVTLNLEKVTG